MTTIHIKKKSSLHYEVWIENFVEVIAEAKVLDAGDCWLVDEIYVHLKHRRKGLATQIIRKLETIKPVKPVGIVNTIQARNFWGALGMTDALGDYEELVLDNCEFDIKVEEAV